MRENLLYLLLLCSISHYSLAQQLGSDIERAWFQGRVILTNGDTLDGIIQLDTEENELLFAFKGDSAVFAFPPEEVAKANYFDPTAKKENTIYSIDLSSTGKQKVFLQKIYEGDPLSIYFRSSPTTIRSVYFDPFTGRPIYFYDQTTNSIRNSVVQKVKDWTIYFKNEQGKFIPYEGDGRWELLQILKDKRFEIKRYMDASKLKPDNLEDIVKVIKRYNLLKNPDNGSMSYKP